VLTVIFIGPRGGESVFCTVSWHSSGTSCSEYLQEFVAMNPLELIAEFFIL
jgi:hypothetical protein